MAPEKFRSKAKSDGGFVFGPLVCTAWAGLGRAGQGWAGLGMGQISQTWRRGVARLLVFPQGTKSAPEHARKNRPGQGKVRGNDSDERLAQGKGRKRTTQTKPRRDGGTLRRPRLASKQRFNRRTVNTSLLSTYGDFQRKLRRRRS